MLDAENEQLEAEDAETTNRRRRRSNIRFLVGTVISAAAVGVIAVTSFDQQIYYFTVAEAAAQATELEHEVFRLKGHVVDGSHVVNEHDLNEHRFLLEADGRQIEVTYFGALPDTFVDGAEVVALGRLQNDGLFVAEDVVAKCPSRYEEQAPTASAS